MTYPLITGDLGDLGESEHIELRDCINITGTISSIASARYVNLIGCPVTGVISLQSTCTEWYLDSTSLTAADIELCINRLYILKNGGGMNNTDIPDFYGVYICKFNMPTIDVGYWAKIHALEEAGWVIQVNIPEESIY